MKRIKQALPYRPSRLLDAICKLRALKTDAQLARLLEIGSPQICKVRNGIQPLSARLLLRIHEVTGLEIRQLKELMGDRRSRQRASRDNLIVDKSLRLNRTVNAAASAQRNTPS
jgi:hypothetical protein